MKLFSFQLHRLVFSLRHSKEERKDLDWEQEEKGKRARREAEERMRENSDAGKKERMSQSQKQTNLGESTNSSLFLSG